jgi:predicted membrane channel-forming protein YqfA (hemolysin III family)
MTAALDLWASLTPGGLLVLLVCVPACLGIVLSCICRINIMTAKHNKLLWAVMYVAMAAYALGELIVVISTRAWPSDHTLAGLLGIGLNLLLTHGHWRDGPPPITCKE